MKIETVFKQNRILIIAIAASLLWHGFWLSTLKIVAPTAREQVKFSKVAFLGPILDRGVMEVRVKARERSFLENRYLSLMHGISEETPILHRGAISDSVTSGSFNGRIMSMIDDAVCGPKLEPPADLR